jgi:hypothetical protein
VSFVVTPLAGTNDNAPSATTDQERRSLLDYWPLAFILTGLTVSVLWSAGLLYLAYLLARWVLI